MSLRLYDSATRATREFVPITPGHARIYHCGLTVQAPPHLGHIRKEVVFDILRRWLEFNGTAVTLVANITDIDDKILSKSAELGTPWWAHAYANERELHNAYQVLGCLPPTYEPRATGHIPEMLELIEVLIERGHAYAANGDVYFDVKSWSDYGELSNQKIEDMLPAEDAPPEGKKDPRDFALWKGYKPGEPETASWPSPWGRGRPGWHLECSAMASKYLGAEFDIHGGGLDLRFPHHENELAQSRAAGQQFARTWMHNALVNTKGEKMSKSLGNSALVSEVIKRFRPIDVRYYLTAAHYRSIIEFADESIAEAATAFERIEGFVRRASEVAGEVELNTVPPSFAEAMDDDLGVPQAIAVIHEHVTQGNKLLSEGKDVTAVLTSVRSMLSVLGLDPVQWSSAGNDDSLTNTIDNLVSNMLAQRESARAQKDFATADSIRDALLEAGIEIEDTAQGARWSVKGGN